MMWVAAVFGVLAFLVLAAAYGLVIVCLASGGQLCRDFVKFRKD